MCYEDFKSKPRNVKSEEGAKEREKKKRDKVKLIKNVLLRNFLWPQEIEKSSKLEIEILLDTR